MNVYTKGAPEAIEQLCIKETIPKNFREQFDGFTAKGYRVFAVATKEILPDERTGKVSP